MCIEMLFLKNLFLLNEESFVQIPVSSEYDWYEVKELLVIQYYLYVCSWSYLEPLPIIWYLRSCHWRWSFLVKKRRHTIEETFYWTKCHDHHFLSVTDPILFLHFLWSAFRDIVSSFWVDFDLLQLVYDLDRSALVLQSRSLLNWSILSAHFRYKRDWEVFSYSITSLFVSSPLEDCPTWTKHDTSQEQSVLWRTMGYSKDDPLFVVNVCPSYKLFYDQDNVQYLPRMWVLTRRCPLDQRTCLRCSVNWWCRSYHDLMCHVCMM